MVSDPPHLVTVIIFTLTVGLISAMAIGSSEPELESTASDAVEVEMKQDASSPVRQFMVLKVGTTNGEDAVLKEFSYDDENRNVQPNKPDDPSRYFYNIINSQGESDQKLSDADQMDNENLSDAGEESVDKILQQWAMRRQTEQEENIPGFHNFPKHIPDHLRPISPFPDAEFVTGRRQSFTPGKYEKRDNTFVPSEKFRPPPRAGPYLYPESIIDREFRVPFN